MEIYGSLKLYTFKLAIGVIHLTPRFDIYTLLCQQVVLALLKLWRIAVWGSISEAVGKK